MRAGETLDELDAFVAGLGGIADAYGFSEGAIRCAACCVDANPASAARAAQRWPHVEHYWLDDRALRELGIVRVPARLVVDADAIVRRRWDGTHGRVLQGRHGLSLANGSHTLVRELADVVHGDADDA